MVESLRKSDPFCKRDITCKLDFYLVYEAFDENNMFSYDHSKPALCKTPNLAIAHSLAYLLNKKYGKIYTIIQNHDQSCRGGYGFIDDDE